MSAGPAKIISPHGPILVAKCDDRRPFVLPKRHYEGDAGFDLASAINLWVAAGTFAQVPTNVRVALPTGTWGLVVGRSSTFYRRNLIVNPGIIDNGWTGELFGVVFNPTQRRIYVQAGERLVQLLIFNLVVPAMEVVEELPERDRGVKGFGSTGGYQDK